MYNSRIFSISTKIGDHSIITQPLHLCSKGNNTNWPYSPFLVSNLWQLSSITSETAFCRASCVYLCTCLLQLGHVPERGPGRVALQLVGGAGHQLAAGVSPPPGWPPAAGPRPRPAAEQRGGGVAPHGLEEWAGVPPREELTRGALPPCLLHTEESWTCFTAARRLHSSIRI